MTLSSYSLHIRQATADDIPRLHTLEQLCFSGDRLSRRSFRRLIKRDTADLWLAESDDDPETELLGYVLVLYRRGTALSRVYSLAVSPSAQGMGIGRRLMQQAEQAADARGCIHMRLEVRADNPAAIRLYQGLRYRQFAAVDDYYEDHTSALRFEKRIHHFDGQAVTPLPFYAQTTAFTCGPASLMMAMAALRPSLKTDRALELQLWREATTIYMTSGHGGCSPHGLALAAHRRGFQVELYVNNLGPLFTEGVRNQAKKSVLEVVHQSFLQELQAVQLPIETQIPDAAALAQRVMAGAIPLVMISSYRFTREKAPHWVVVSAADDRYLYLHDPEIDEDDEASATDNVYVPVPYADFDRMARFGQNALRTTVVLS
ncbi:MAG: GNAT family N-acetyltransferase/peptidase C39 family protein [Natronospirillum sp.]